MYCHPAECFLLELHTVDGTTCQEDLLNVIYTTALHMYVKNEHTNLCILQKKAGNISEISHSGKV